MTEPLVVRRETHIASPPATVFAFLTDPEKILSWMGAEATTEPHPGGLYLVKGIHGRHARGAFRAREFCANPVQTPRCPPTQGTPFNVGAGPPETTVGAPL